MFMDGNFYCNKSPHSMFMDDNFDEKESFGCSMFMDDSFDQNESPDSVFVDDNFNENESPDCVFVDDNFYENESPDSVFVDDNFDDNESPDSVFVDDNFDENESYSTNDSSTNLNIFNIYCQPLQDKQYHDPNVPLRLLAKLKFYSRHVLIGIVTSL